MHVKPCNAVSLALGMLAIAGLFKWQRLERQLAQQQAQYRLIQERHVNALRTFRQSGTHVPPGQNGIPDRHLAAEERLFYQRRMQRLEERMAFLETAAAAVRAPRPPAATGEETVVIDAASALDTLLPVFNQPELRELLRVRMLVELEQQYGSLLVFFDYDPASEDTLLALLLEKHWNAMNLRLAAMQPGIDPELRRNAVATLQADQADLRGVLYDFLGPDDFAFYDEYERTQPERLHVGDLQKTLAERGIALDDRQEHALIRVLYEERSAYAETYGDGSGADIRDRLEAMARMHDRVLERAAPILSADQMDWFAGHAAKKRVMNESALRTNAAR